MKISISGASGFIGKNLLEFYKDHEIQTLPRNYDVWGSLNVFKPDLIIHSAAEIYDSDAMFDSNVLYTKCFLDWLRDNPGTKMIHIGSSSEYGIVDRATSEKDRCDPVDMYQSTKAMSTLMCQGYARSYKLDIKIVRPYSVYGKYEKPHRLFPRLYKAFILQQPMTLHDGVHDFIYIDDFINGINLVVNKDNNLFGDIINLGSGTQYTNLEILDKFVSITGKTAPISVVPVMAKTFESHTWVCDTTYAEHEYNFKCKFTIEDGIREFLRTALYVREY